MDKAAEPTPEPIGVGWQASMLAFLVIMVLGITVLALNAASEPPALLVANLGGGVTVIGMVGFVASALGAWATRVWI